MNSAHLVAQQYKTSANLDARIQLHERFSTNPYPWMLWVFDQFELPATSRILEVGCGTGKLWRENLHRIPPGWEIILADQSAGMLQQAQQNLGDNAQRFQFQQLDVQSLPFADEYFDAVIANHMLYHVPDLPRGLAEIRRVLKPQGQLYAATNGKNHMIEIHELVVRFMPEDPVGFWREGFSLETGAELLAPFFAQVELRRFDDSLLVTEAEPLTAYVFSSSRFPPERHAAFATYVEQELRARNGVIYIQKDGGLFRAVKL